MPEHAVANWRIVAARVKRGWHTQEDFTAAYEDKARELREQAMISVRQVRRWESGESTWPNRDARRVLEAMFGCPLEDLGFRRPARPTGRRPGGSGRQVEEHVRRRTLLGLVGTAPVLDLTALDRLTAAAHGARCYGDRELLGHLRTALDDAARADGLAGPREALPTVLGILAAINSAARTSVPGLRRELLALGARGAELTAWLHRDAGAPAPAVAYWHHQAKEWATLTGDGAMHAYVLLRQAQATDRTGAARMLDLAHAATAGPWTLPPGPRAEAFQQQARALALTGVRIEEVARTLDQAHNALGQATPASGPATCTGPLGDGYTRERLMVQSAICYREAGQSERAVSLFGEHLATAAFAPRDRAFFTAQYSGALVAAGEPDEAASTAMEALALASGARFGQVLAELHRTADDLTPYAQRPAVREFRQRLGELVMA
ncbi:MULTISPECIES: XRE family transcriptional regulator [unclassified Streptomyces]|uniref:helix-turn-helix domain-containing protein n=1 Tax=unclassified Streptomyces TaxID=2593676 RepID=UPI0020247F46|nr:MULTISPECIES: XRE family transcriptional regulator [unclassified Streptomyces]WSC25177.1 XRE family transcriptional regulator [Streptomyces sp. NBC_01766]